MSAAGRSRALRLAPLLLFAGACGESAVDVTDEKAPSAPAETGENAVKDAASLAESAPAARTIDKGDGCIVEIATEGTGKVACVGDEITLRYTLKVKDAEEALASTKDWIEPCRLRLDTAREMGVIPGLARGIEGLRAGARASIQVPSELAYGKAGQPGAGVPEGVALVLDVEILEVR